MSILLPLTIIYCIYLHYRISRLQEKDTSIMFELIDDYSNLHAEIGAVKKKVKKLKDKKCCNEKPRRNPAKMRSRIPKTAIPKD